MDAVTLQRVGGVEYPLHRDRAVALLAIGDEGFGEVEIADDALGLRPLLEEIVVLEEVVVPKAAWAITRVCIVAEFSSMM